MPWNLTMFLVGTSASALVAWGLLRWRGGTVRWGLDHADEPRKTHGAAKPRIGGLAIFPVCLVMGLVLQQPLAISLGAVLMFALGFGDDLVRINSRRKLEIQIGVAVLLFLLGLRLESVPSFAGNPVVLPWALSLVLTIVWIIGWTNAINLIDGLDGLATGIAMIGMMFVSVLLPGGAMAWGIAGGAAGFLFFNFPRARMFLGDGGAYLLGFLFAALSLGDGEGRGIPFLATVLCVPLLDTAYAFLRRVWRRVPVMKGDAEHIHHQLQALGCAKPVAALILHAVTLIAGLVGLWSFQAGGGGWAGLGGVLIAGTGGIWYLASRPGQVGTAGQNSSAKPASSKVVGSETVSSSST